MKQIHCSFIVNSIYRCDRGKVEPSCAEGFPSPKRAALSSYDGVYVNAICGALCSGNVGPGAYLCIPSTFDPGVECNFDLMVWSSKPCKVLAMIDE